MYPCMRLAEFVSCFLLLSYLISVAIKIQKKNCSLEIINPARKKIIGEAFFEKNILVETVSIGHYIKEQLEGNSGNSAYYVHLSFNQRHIQRKLLNIYKAISRSYISQGIMRRF